MLHVGDTLPALTDTLIGEDGPLDLDGATVELTLVGPATIEGTATIGETAGAVSYPWADGDTEVGGIYQARWRVTTVAGVRTITGTDVAIYDPDAVWITPAEVGEPDLPIDVVVRQLIAAQQRIVDWCTRTIPSPTPSKVKEALATLTRRALREPASAGGAAVSYESLADYAVRYVSPFAKGTVLDPAAHPDIVEMLRPWRPTGYSSDISGDGESVDRADTVDEVPNGLPEGGAVGRVLAKASGRDYDVEWIPAPTGIPAGGAPGQILARSADGLEWIDPTDGPPPTAVAVLLVPSLSPLDGDLIAALVYNPGAPGQVGSTDPEATQLEQLTIPVDWEMFETWDMSTVSEEGVGERVLLMLPGDTEPTVYASVNADGFTPIEVLGGQPITVSCGGAGWISPATWVGFNDDGFNGMPGGSAPATSFKPHGTTDENVWTYYGRTGNLSGKSTLRQVLDWLDSFAPEGGYPLIPATYTVIEGDGAFPLSAGVIGGGGATLTMPDPAGVPQPRSWVISAFSGDIVLDASTTAIFDETNAGNLTYTVAANTVVLLTCYADAWRVMLTSAAGSGAAPLTEAVMAEIDDGSVLPATGGAFYGAGTAYLPAAASITSPRAMIVSATSDDVVVAGDDDPTIYDANGEAVATVTIPRGWSALVASDGTAWRVLGLADANETNDSHTVAAWTLVRSSFDPTVTPTVMPPGAALYLFTAEQGVEYAHAGLWYGTSDGVTPSLMVPSRRKVRTADMFLSRAFLDARGGFVDGLPQPELDEFDQPTPVLPSEFPQSYRSPRRVDGYVSSVSGPAAPVWSPVMEFDFADVKVAPSVDDLSDFELGTPNPGDVPTWDPGTGGDPEDPGYIPGRFVPVPAPSGAVTSVNGLDGDVVLTASDVGADPAGTAAAAVSALVAGAPGALDTLNELAAAINDDASYAAAVTTALSGKQASSSELTLLAALTTTSFGRSLLEKANAAAVASALGIERGGSRVVAVHGAGNTINEPTSATSILTSGAFTLPALAAGDRWVLEGDFDAVQNSGASRNLTLTAAFGATNATATAASVTASSTTRSCTFRIVGVCLTPTSHSITVHWDYPSVLVRGKATSTVDTSSAGTVLDLKVTTSAASTTQTFQLTNATLTVDRAAT